MLHPPAGCSRSLDQQLGTLRTRRVTLETLIGLYSVAPDNSSKLATSCSNVRDNRVPRNVFLLKIKFLNWYKNYNFMLHVLTSPACS